MRLPLQQRLLGSITPEHVALVAIGLGSLIRIQHFLTRRSLWSDEAALAFNITQRDFGGLLDPLDGNQGAPVLFLWVQRSTVLILGNNEYALRLVPLLAGMAVIPLAYLVGRRLGSPGVGAVAAALTAVSPALIRYSTEVKQYSTDAAVTLALVLLALTCAEHPRRARRLVALGAAGAVAVWISHPAAFVMAGVGLVLLADHLRDRDWRGLGLLASVGATWGISIAVLYLVSLRDLTRNEFLIDFWQQGFPPRPLGLTSGVRWLGRATIELIEDPGGLVPAVLALGALTASIVVLALRDRIVAAMVLAPAAVTLVAATAEVYPFRGRLALFLVPVALVLLATLVDTGRWRWAALALIGSVSIGSVVDTVGVVADPPEFAASRPVFQHVVDQLEPGDQVWVHDVTIEPYRYYAPIVGLVADRRTSWLDRAACDGGALGDDEPATAARGRRVWVVFAYTLSTRPDDEVEILRALLDDQARRISTIDRDDASATLYDFGAPPSAPSPATGSYPDQLACLRASPESPIPSTGLATGPVGSGSRS
jgi:hypothetical protein